MNAAAVQLYSPLAPERCVEHLERVSGRLWRFMPWLHGVQRSPILFARRGPIVVLASKNAIGRLRNVVALQIRPGKDGGSLLQLTSLHDPVLAITELMWFPALVFAVTLPLLHRLLHYNTVLHFPLTMLAALFLLSVFVHAAGMRKPPPQPPDPEVLAFLQTQLNATA